jgi:hypothetical protein
VTVNLYNILLLIGKIKKGNFCGLWTAVIIIDQDKQMVDFLWGAKKVEIILQTYIFIMTEAVSPLLFTIEAQKQVVLLL